MAVKSERSVKKPDSYQVFSLSAIGKPDVLENVAMDGNCGQCQESIYFQRFSATFNCFTSMRVGIVIFL